MNDEPVPTLDSLGVALGVVLTLAAGIAVVWWWRR